MTKGKELDILLPLSLYYTLALPIVMISIADPVELPSATNISSTV